jgi:NAD(P)-dependent dehydrogenase (short-subunit alcohol dehydrogenase family)
MAREQRRVAIVSGGAGALGRATARRLVRDGFAVVVADLDLSSATEAARAIDSAGDAAFAFAVDMRDPQSVTALVDDVVDRVGRVDVVVNNAAVPSGAPLRDLPVAEWDAVMEVNVRGAVLLCQAVYPCWESLRRGAVVNVSSRTWMSGGPPAYVSSKAALVGLTRSLAVELAPLNVTANAVAPSFVSTSFTQAGRSAEEAQAAIEQMERLTKLGRLCSPEDVAGTISFLVSPDATYITGEIVHVSGGAQLAPVG